jgi:hypothetical protein
MTNKWGRKRRYRTLVKKNGKCLMIPHLESDDEILFKKKRVIVP